MCCRPSPARLQGLRNAAYQPARNAVMLSMSLFSLAHLMSGFLRIIPRPEHGASRSTLSYTPSCCGATAAASCSSVLIIPVPSLSDASLPVSVYVRVCPLLLSTRGCSSTGPYAWPSSGALRGVEHSQAAAPHHYSQHGTFILNLEQPSPEGLQPCDGNSFLSRPLLHAFQAAHRPLLP